MSWCHSAQTHSPLCCAVSPPKRQRQPQPVPLWKQQRPEDAHVRTRAGDPAVTLTVAWVPSRSAPLRLSSSLLVMLCLGSRRPHVSWNGHSYQTIPRQLEMKPDSGPSSDEPHGWLAPTSASWAALIPLCPAFTPSPQQSLLSEPVPTGCSCNSTSYGKGTDKCSPQRVMLGCTHFRLLCNWIRRKTLVIDGHATVKYSGG